MSGWVWEPSYIVAGVHLKIVAADTPQGTTPQIQSVHLTHLFGVAPQPRPTAQTCRCAHVARTDQTYCMPQLVELWWVNDDSARAPTENQFP